MSHSDLYVNQLDIMEVTLTFATLQFVVFHVALLLLVLHRWAQNLGQIKIFLKYAVFQVQFKHFRGNSEVYEPGDKVYNSKQNTLLLIWSHCHTQDPGRPCYLSPGLLFPPLVPFVHTESQMISQEEQSQSFWF